MLVYHIRASALVAAKGIDVRIVAVDQDTGLGLTQSDWQQLGGPEDTVLCGPCVLWVAVEAVDENDVYSCFGMGIDFGDLETLDLVEGRSRALLHRES